MSRKPATLHDIARRAGVSEMTVSRALRGMEGVSQSRRAEIEALAQELGYVPNLNARSLVNASADLIGISFPTLFNDVFAEVLEGLQKTVENAGLTTVVNTTYYDPEQEMAWVERLLSWRPVGIVLTGVDHAPELVRLVRASNVPCVETWDVTGDPIDSCVGIDHVQSGRALAQYAISLGYRRPGIVRLPTGHDRRLDKRVQGIQDSFMTIESVQRVQHSVQDDANSFKQGFLGTQDLMSGAETPDVIFYVNDHVAFGGIAACEAMGVVVPDDLGLVGFNGLDICAAVPRKLTTAFSPRRQIGIQAARNLIAKINGVTPPAVTKLSVKVAPGGTTRRL